MCTFKKLFFDHSLCMGSFSLILWPHYSLAQGFFLIGNLINVDELVREVYDGLMTTPSHFGLTQACVQILALLLGHVTLGKLLSYNNSFMRANE